MNNRMPYLSFLVVAGGVAALLAGTARSQMGAPKQVVALQASTPGVSQSGHLNVSGKIMSGQLATGAFTMSGGSAGKVLTSDATGVASWQTPSIPAPYVMTINDIVPTFKAVNTGFGYALYAENPNSMRIALSAVAGHANGGYAIVGQIDGQNGAAVTGLHNSVSGTGIGIQGDTNSADGVGVRGQNTNLSYGNGVEGFADGQGGYGVYGFSRNLGGLGRGVFGRATALSATGVFGAHDGDGRAVSGFAYGTAGTGVFGRVNTETSGHEAFGVRGLAMGNTGYGGFFEGPTGIHAISLNSGYAAWLAGVVRIDGNVGLGSLPGSERLRIYGNTADVQSVVNTGSGRGIFVATNSDTGIWSTTATGFTGVDGRTGSSTGFGIYGVNNNGSGSGHGVVGQTTGGTGFGVYALGNSGASGTKSFRIDHPLDPENKYLLHYATESPSPQNFYSGNLVTDQRGKAWVELPEYFSEINANFKYQLTVLDDSESDGFVQVKIGRKIQGNRFLVMTSAPNIEVSWRIEADRNDPWVRQKGAPEVTEKSKELRGTYQHPELYGQPQERAETFRALSQKVPK